MEIELPKIIDSVAELEDLMTRPTTDLVEALATLEGDLMILGVGGKTGPTLARLAKRAFQEAGQDRRVIGVSRFSNPQHRSDLEKTGIETMVCDLLNRRQIARLPEIPNLIFMAGMKFGSAEAQATNWAMNTLVPGYVAEHFPNSRFVALSSGNIYPFTTPASGGPTEETEPDPIGEYAQSVLGRERIFEYFSRTRGNPVAIARLNYAIDLRYGVLLDIATQVWNGNPIDLAMGYVNLIWQGDANRHILQCLVHSATPPAIFNVAGSEILSVRKLAEEFGKLLGKEPILEGKEAETALLSMASKANRLFGAPNVSVEKLIEWTAHWVSEGKPTLEKPTHFQTRNGKF